MSELRPLLIEFGCEELPVHSVDALAQSFANNICDLELHGFTTETEPHISRHAPWPSSQRAQHLVYATPRRIAVFVQGVASAQEPFTEEIYGPPVSAGRNATGNPTPALLGFAKKHGIDISSLREINTQQGLRFGFHRHRAGSTLAEFLPGFLIQALQTLPILQPMRWGDHDFAFVRPMHWLVVLHGEQVIDVEIFGVKSGRESRGHRFHHPQPVEIKTPDAYVDALRSANVLCDPQERRTRVREQVTKVSDTMRKPRLRDALLDEIANLTEWPVAIACEFEHAFLDVPHEALIQTMETNQKFVPVFDANGKLTEHFIGVANIESKDPAEIRKGYERVIRPRFADAKFFYDEDLKSPLSSHQESLKTVTYQQQLGSVWDKCIRVAELSRVIGNRLGVDAALATRAASLSKCDLMTRMVGEFPELQGVMGRYYATANGESADVASALDEFYRPRFAGDEIAHGKVAQVLAIAERLDTLAGIFAVGMKPSGNKDPFALRRAALGLGRTLIEGNLDLDLEASLREAIELLPPIAPQKKKDGAPEKSPSESKQSLTQELLDFVFERLRGYYAEKNIGSDQFDAVRAVEPETLTDFDVRLRAVSDFASLPDAAALATANKRIGNILRQAGDSAGFKVDPKLLDAGAERALHDQVEKVHAAIAPLLEQRKYVETLRALAALRAPVDTFFDGVMVMVDDETKRHNRIALLSGLRRMFLQVADISVLQQA